MSTITLCFGDVPVIMPNGQVAEASGEFSAAYQTMHEFEPEDRLIEITVYGHWDDFEDPIALDISSRDPLYHQIVEYMGDYWADQIADDIAGDF